MFFKRPLTGDVFRKLRVRISEPWEMSTPRKIFEVFFWLETSRNDHSKRGVKLQVLLSLSPCAFLLSKNTLLFPELLFYLPKLLILSCNCLFFRSAFLFLKNILLFSRIALLVFQKCLPFIYCALLFLRMIFSN